jgi:hypothetical protein
MPGFFSKAQKTIFKVDDYDFVEAVDLTTGFKSKDFLRDFAGISYQPYVIQDGERPDNVANKVYDDPTLDWVVLLANNIHSIYDEWPKDTESFKQYIIQKFGSLETAMATVKYYYDGNGNVINATDYSALAANTGKRIETEYQYELRINTNKSKIRVFTPGVARTMASSLRNLNRKPIV